MAKNKIIKTTILAGIFSAAFAENSNKPNLYRNFDWEDLLNKFEEYKKNILQKCEKSVVEIYGTKKERVNLDGFIFDNSDLFNTFNFFEDEKNEKEEHLNGIKTQELKTNGFILDGNGYILTNYSNVKGFKDLKVKIGGKEYKVIDVNFDVYSDLALLKIDSINLEYLPLGDEKNIKNSKSIVNIGVDKIGFLKTSVEADNKKENNSVNKKKGWKLFKKSKNKKESEEKKEEDKGKCVFKNTTNASIPGCECLINLKGEIVGFKVKYGKFLENKIGKYCSIIPSSKIKNIIDCFKNGKKITYDLCGLKLIENDDKLASEKLLKIKYGCFVDDVDAEMEKIGFKKYDVIVGINGYSIDSLNSLFKMFDLFKKSDLIFTVKRLDKDVDIKVDFGIMSDIKLEIADNKLKTKDFVFANRENNTVEMKCLNNSVPGLDKSLIITSFDRKKVKNIEEILYLIKKELLKNKDVINLSVLIEGYYPDNTEEKKVFGIKIS